MKNQIKNGKNLIGAGVILGVAGIAYALSQKKEIPPEEEAAQIIIEIFDAEGNPVPTQSPAIVDEGSDYTIRVTVVNQSTKAGVLWEAELNISVHVTADTTIFINGLTDGFLTHSFAAGESWAFTWPISIPVGFGASSGLIDARVTSPYGIVLASAQEQLTIQEVAIDYGATIVIGV